MPVTMGLLEVMSPILFLAYGLEAFNRLLLIFDFALISLAPGLLKLGGVFPPQNN